MDTKAENDSTSHLLLKKISGGYDHTVIVHDIDISLAKGSFGVLLGSNGAGKTTILRAIMGMAKTFEGEIVVDGVSLQGLSTREILAKGVALSPEGRQVFSSLSVEENLLTGCIAASGWRDRRSRLSYVYEHFPLLSDRRDQDSGTLSGGEQQMLAIGRALMSKPSLLLVDEASLGLAPVMVEHVFELLAQINKVGVTVLAVEQNVAVTHYADYLYVLEHGRITMGGAAAEISERLRQEIASAYLGRASSPQNHQGETP